MSDCTQSNWKNWKGLNSPDNGQFGLSEASNGLDYKLLTACVQEKKCNFVYQMRFVAQLMPSC